MKFWVARGIWFNSVITNFNFIKFGANKHEFLKNTYRQIKMFFKNF